jgi:hypothetical protein
LQSNVRDHGIHFPKKPWKEIVTEETSQTIEIRNKPNPWLYGPPLFLTAAAISTQPNFLGYITALIVFIALAAWWLLRSQAVVISLETREATFVRSSLNPFRKCKIVSLGRFSRVYAIPFYKNGGWEIHLSSSKGEHLLLARIPSPWSPTFRSDYVRSLCAKIASGLQISDGGGG